MFSSPFPFTSRNKLLRDSATFLELARFILYPKVPTNSRNASNFVGLGSS